VDEQTFLNKLDRIRDIPTLPTVAIKVNQMLQYNDTSIRDLSKTIEKDQAIVSKLLRLVNSAFYGFQARINTISHAVTVLGFNTVRNAVVSVSIIEAFSGKGGAEDFDMKDFWKHSIAVAVTGRNLAEDTRLATPDEAFVAGILHDVGKVVLAQYFKDLFNQVWTSIQNNGLSFYEAEKKVLPANHAQIGGHLAKKWHLPVSLIEAVTYHHAVRKSAINPELLMLVHVADFIVNHYKIGSHGEPDLSGMHPEASKRMAAQLEAVSDWFPEVATEIDAACQFFLEKMA
jgi:putative nucleotidyltransferase with HDIG domain